MAYRLGPVKDHVRPVADEIGGRFGVETVYGYANRNIAGTGVLSDHARGLALDFMTYSDRAKGQAIANYGIANASRLNVKYIIWNRQIWRPGRGWYSYTGKNPHTDHPHFSFNAGGSYTNDGQANVGDTASGNVEDLSKLATLTAPSTWIRVALFIGGVSLLFIALLAASGKQLKGILNV